MKETGIKRKSKKKISYLILALVGALSLSQIFLPSPTKENYFSLNIKDLAVLRLFDIRFKNVIGISFDGDTVVSDAENVDFRAFVIITNFKGLMHLLIDSDIFPEYICIIYKEGKIEK